MRNTLQQKKCRPRKFHDSTNSGIAECHRRFRELSLLARCGLWCKMGPNLISTKNVKIDNFQISFMFPLLITESL